MVARLTAEQQGALDNLAAAHRVRVTARMDAEAEAARIIEQRTTSAKLAESRALRVALLAGVPRTRAHRDGLNTKDWATVDKILALTADEASTERAIHDAALASRIRAANELEAAAYRVMPGDRVLRIDWPGFTPEPGGYVADTYGERVDLRGFFSRRANRRSDWTALEDDTDPEWAERKIGTGPLQPALEDEAALHLAAAAAWAAL